MEKNVLKIGELAARSGLTVRALHHYDDIGLLTPSARADSGYRLYNRDDLARLHKIQTLRKFGMSLADIGSFLASPEAPFTDVVSRQISALDQQIEQASTLRAQLLSLQQRMENNEDPDLQDWLGALEQMKLYEQYFTPDELRRLPFWQQEARRSAQWRVLVEQVKSLMARGVSTASEEASLLSLRWMEMLEQDTGADLQLAWRMQTMLQQEQQAGAHSPISARVRQYMYIGEAFMARKMAIYAKYLNQAEMQSLRENSPRQSDESIALFLNVRRHIENGFAPEDPSSQALGKEWLRLFPWQSAVGKELQAKVDLAHDSEPELLKGTWINQASVIFIRKAVAACGGL
jgi:DNA-binding transcriptional MerR regulator